MTPADLFTWREEVEAAQRVAQAEAERASAERSCRYAPHGQVRARQARLQAATAEALAAEIRLARLRAEGQP